MLFAYVTDRSSNMAELKLDLYTRACLADAAEQKLTFWGRLRYAFEVPRRSALILICLVAWWAAIDAPGQFARVLGDMGVDPGGLPAVVAVLLFCMGAGPLFAIGQGAPWLKVLTTYLSTAGWVFLGVLSIRLGGVFCISAGTCFLFAVFTARAGMLFNRQWRARFDEPGRMGR